MTAGGRLRLPKPEKASCALVTGASSGLGAAFARELARRGHNVALVARREDRLLDLSVELQDRYAVQAEAIACDLTDPVARSNLSKLMHERGSEVSILVNCAGFGLSGAFITSDPERVTSMLQTNVVAAIALTHLFAGPMVARERGAILFVSSLGAFHPAPMFGVYAASKAAIQSFSEALSAELRPNHVTVTALCPGPVDTEFNQVAGVQPGTNPFPSGMIASVDDCVRAAFDGIQRGRNVVVPKASVKLLAFVMKHVPHSLSLPIWHRFLTRPQ
jgi:short-subunit dehydrogenase